MLGQFFLLAVILLTRYDGVKSLSSGAPLEACDGIPGHTAYAKEYAAPYTITVTPIEGSTNSVHVTIAASSDSKFKGFFITAKKSATEEKVLEGQFESSQNYHTRDCVSTKVSIYVYI